MRMHHKRQAKERKWLSPKKEFHLSHFCVILSDVINIMSLKLPINVLA